MSCFHSFVPPYILERVTASGSDREGIAAATLELDARLRRAHRKPVPRAGSGLKREVDDAAGAERLPGAKVRGEGDPAVGDSAADQAYDGLGAVYRYYSEVHGRDSLDGAGSALLATVHYGQKYDNAFFNGERMVFGDGDGTLFLPFTRALDVIGHELTHGVVADETGIAYEGQDGAINESVADVFGSLVKQYTRRQSVTEADWLIGDEILAPGVHGVALRSMAAPGTAYDDPTLGKDPQPASMAGYVETTEDNGGVHINSGIPNKAFHDAAVTLGGKAWETVGPVWYATLLDDALDQPVDFAAFATATVRVAAGLPGGDVVAPAVRAAWEGVGITVPARLLHSRAG
jgi:Zn-dependent metalloprotease